MGYLGLLRENSRFTESEWLKQLEALRRSALAPDHSPADTLESIGYSRLSDQTVAFADMAGTLVNENHVLNCFARVLCYRKSKCRFYLPQSWETFFRYILILSPLAFSGSDNWSGLQETIRP